MPLPKPHQLTGLQARQHADILDALADDLEAHHPRHRAGPVGIAYGSLVGDRARRTVIAAIRFRARAFRRRYDQWLSSLNRDE